MSPITEILLRLALFEGLALLILGSVLLSRRLSDQPLERIRIVQFGLAAVALALLFTSTSILPGSLHISLGKAEQVPSQQELMPELLPEPAEETVFVADTVKRNDAEMRSTIIPIATRRPEQEIVFAPQEYPVFSPVEVESKAATSIPEPVAVAAVPVRPQAGVRFSLSPETVLLSLFGLPVLLLLAWNLTARLKLHGILKRSEPALEFIQELFRTIRGTSKCRVELRMSGDIDTPMVFGLFRPVLLLPLTLCERSRNSDAELRACLAHEWSHLRRGDLLTWNIVQLFQYPLWVQPFYWMLRSRLLADQDFLADDDGARSLSDRTDYAEILLAMARSRLASPPQNVLGMAGRKSQLTRRIEMLFNTEQFLLQKSRKRKLLLPIVFLAALVLLGGTMRLRVNAEEKQTTTSQVPEENDFFVKKFLAALKEKRFDDAANCFSEKLLGDEWSEKELGGLFVSCEKRNAVKRGVHPSKQQAVIVGPLEKYDTPVKKTYPGGGELWESVIRFQNAAMSIVFAVGKDGRILGFEIAAIPNEPAPQHCGWRGGSGIAENRGYDYALDVECFDAEEKILDTKNHSWDNLYVNLFQRISDEDFVGDNGDIWTDPSDGTHWKRAESYQRQNGPGIGLFQENICNIPMLPAGTFRVLLTAFQWKGDNTGSGNAFSEPVTLDAANKRKTIKLRLRIGGSLASNIVDAETGETLDACMTGLSCEHIPQMIGYGWHVKHNGRTRYDYLVPGKYTFEIHCDDDHASDPVYEPERKRYEATVKAGEETKITVKMRKREHTQTELDERWPYILTGTVCDPSGEPLADAGVIVRRNDIFVSGIWPSTSTKTDKDGRFTLRFNPYELQAMRAISPVKPTPEKPDCMGFRVEVEKEGYVWKGTRHSNGEIQGGDLDETGKATTYSSHFCVEPVPDDLSKIECGFGKEKRKIKPEEVAYRLKPYKVDIVMEPIVSVQESGQRNKDRVSGTVLDPQGKRVAGAKVILTEGNGSGTYQFASTKEDGSYAFRDWEGAGVVYVFAKGFGPASESFKIGDGKDRHSSQFKLGPGKTVRIKVLDRRGNPIPEARIDPERWREELARFNDGPIDSGIPKRADQNGVWEWNWAPDDDVVYSIYGTKTENRCWDYMAIRHVSLQPREEEYAFTLNDLLKISGKVVDAETKEAIKEFSVVPATTYGRENIKSNVHYFYKYSQDFKDGVYQLSYDDPVPHVGGKEGRVFKFAADGYEPIESEVFANDRGTVEYNVELKRSDKPVLPKRSGTVLTPDGKPATGAKVAVAMDSNYSVIEIRDGELTSWNSGDYVVDVDENGVFQLPEIEGVFTVVAIHDSGVAQTTGERLAEDNTMRLSAWARIEGILMLEGKPGKRLPIEVWKYGNQGEAFKHHGRNPPRYVAFPKTDDQGKFVINRFPPLNEVSVKYNESLRPDEGGMPSVDILKVPVPLEPGKTATVQLGGKGVSVFGKFVLPEGWKSINWKGAKVALRPDLGPEPKFPQPNIPEEILNKYTEEILDSEGKTQRSLREDLTEEEKDDIRKILEDYKPTEEERKAREKYYQYMYDKQHLSPDSKRDGIVAKDGTFRVYGVLPGKYVLRIELIVPGVSKKDDDRTYFHSETVPIAVENEAVDMKETTPVFREISESKWSHAHDFE